jgi:predicted DCC family thiol-disulfide oxidoreductase YuxK
VAPTAFSYRDDPAVPPFPDDKPIVIFDGHCVMCSGFARFILHADRAARMRLMPAQSEIGQALYRHFGLNATTYETYILLANGEASFRSEATIRICENLGFPWSLARVSRVVPLAWRDRFYDFIARNRLRWFGARQVCYRPEPAHMERFLG